LCDVCFGCFERCFVKNTTEIIFIRPERAAQLVREQPAWAEYIFKLYQSRFEELLSTVTKVKFKHLDARILDLLSEKTNVFNTKMLPVTHQEIADEIGSQREAVSRVLKKMEKEGLVKLFRGKIQIV
jgi:CRP/FNR family transcriptional regulator, anaerobic regulatory protein